jgi:chromosomal replication initiator protein
MADGAHHIHAAFPKGRAGLGRSLGGGPVDAGQVWEHACAALRERVGAGRFQSWIAPLALLSVEGGVATLGAPTSFLGSYVSRNFGEEILAALAAAGAPAGRLLFQAESRHALPDAPRPAAPASPPSREAMPEALAGRLDPRLTFDRFVLGRPNEVAHAAARRVAEGTAREAGFNPLVLCGGVGLGKTHLLQAVAHEMRARDPQARVLYLSAEQFMLRFVSALRDRSTMEFKRVVREVDVLLMDDVQFIAGKESTQEEFLHTFNALMDAGRQVVLAADRAPAEIAGLDERMASRLQSGLVVEVEQADQPLRLALLEARLAQARAADAGLRIAPGVTEFLAGRVTANLRVLEGALTRLLAQASLARREVTLDLARDTLGDVLRAADRKVSIEEIQRRVADHFNIRVADLVGPKRVRNFARPRQLAMYLAKTMTSRSLPDIGRRFGGRDHTTVLHGVRRITELKGQDAQVADDLAALRRALEG